MKIQILLDIIAKALEVEPSKVSIQSSMKTIGEWDSLSHIRIITAIEDHYGIQLNENDMMQMISVERIKEILVKKVVE